MKKKEVDQYSLKQMRELARKIKPFSNNWIKEIFPDVYKKVDRSIYPDLTTDKIRYLFTFSSPNEYLKKIIYEVARKYLDTSRKKRIKKLEDEIAHNKKLIEETRKLMDTPA